MNPVVESGLGAFNLKNRYNSKMVDISKIIRSGTRLLQRSEATFH